MGYDDRREIFERLEALERMVRSRRDERGSWEHRGGGGDRDRRGHGGGRDGGRHGGRGRGDDDFEEKRIIDTIVRLVTEQVGRMLQDQQAHDGRGGDGFDEKRVVDLIVFCVSEHVQEIVATELDRRFGPADAPRGGGEHGPEGPGSSEPAGR
jgi:hypothetical protein